MPQFPDLLPAQRRALFEIVEVFRKHDLEGRAVIVSPPQVGDTRLIFHTGQGLEFLDTDLETLGVLDEAGCVAFSERSRTRRNGSEWILHTLTLKKLGVDYYDWAHRPAVYKILSGFWYSLRPFVLPALISSIFTLLVWIILNWLSGRGLSTLP